MKKIVLAVSLMLVYNISMACRTVTTVNGGVVTVCTICPDTIICN